MQRRNLLIGMGSLAAGGAATIGTGAFTSVQADRSVDVEVAGDSSAYLALQKAADDATDPGANSDAYVTKNSGEVSFDFSSSNGTANLGSGFNPNAVTVIEDLIEVQNQGTQSAYLGVDLSNLDVSDGSNDAGIELAVSTPDDGTTSSQSATDSELESNIAFQGNGNAVGNATAPSSYELGVGEAVHLDLTVDTTNFSAANVSTQGGSITFIADQTSSL